MKCACHGEACYWHADPRREKGGYWRCIVVKRERERGEPKQPKRARQLAYWHKPGGGYVRRRKRTLAAQRVQVLEQLDQLAQEAVSAES